MTRPLTERTIEALKKRPRKERLEVPDGDGLFLILQPSGVVSWAYRYRSPLDRKQRKLTIGRYPAYSLALAREAARAAARTAGEGRDPADEKQLRLAVAGDSRNSVGAQLDDFMKRHVQAKLKASTCGEIKRIFDREVRPVWGDRKIDAIAKRDVISLLDGITDRGSTIMANRVLAHLKKFFNWAASRDVIAASPAALVEAPGDEISRDRTLSDEEIKLLWRATAQPSALTCAVRVLLLTGQRRGEVQGMVFAELDLEADQPLWSIPKERTKNGLPHLVPLSPAAVEAINLSPRIAGSQFVFTTTGKTPVSGWSRSKAIIDADMLAEAKKDSDDPESVSLADWRLHDLRRTTATMMSDRLKMLPHVVESVLNHISGTKAGVAGTYNKAMYFDEKTAALLAWGALVLKIATGIPTANVIELFETSRGRS